MYQLLRSKREMDSREKSTFPREGMQTPRLRRPQAYKVFCSKFRCIAMINQRPAAAFVAASSATFSSWTGFIVPRIMPEDGSSDAAANAIKSTNAVTEKHRIDPCLLCPEKGFEFHPLAPKQQSQQDKSDSAKPSNYLCPAKVDDKSQSTTLDVYVFPPAANQIEEDSGPLSVKMDRSSQEFVNSTLRRMILSINKQISKKLRKEKKQKKGKQQQQQQVSANDDAILIHKSSLDTPWNVQELTNQQVWTEAMTTPLQVNLALENVNLSLQVDSCPPTIVTVETFEDFESRVFCHVPLTVEVQSLFTTHVAIDWYVDGQLVCADSSTFTPRQEDIGKKVSILITPMRTMRKDPSTNTCHFGQGYEEAYLFELPVEALPVNTVTKLRQGAIWTNFNRRSEPADSSLRVLTYNVLADQNAYARTGSGKEISCYPYVELSTLEKRRRMPLLLHEILSYQPDLICLQEVDENIWRRLLRPALEQAGYQGYFSTKVTKGMSEGCALLWSLHRFESIPAEGMKQYGLSELIKETITNQDSKWKSATDIAAVLEQKADLKSVIEDKLGHVVQMVSLPLIKSSKQDETAPDRILVANTHLFYHPYGAHIRLMQMYAICQQFERFRTEANAAYPMLLCGDMNSSLRRAAGYLLIHRQVASDHSQIPEHFNTYEWRERNETASNAELQSEDNVRVEHTEKDKRGGEGDWEVFPTVSLPDHFPSFLTGYPTEPDFTHYLDKFVGSLDHIFISQSSNDNPHGFSPLRSAPMPTVADATEMVAMPSEKFPSDHVSLVADLQFTTNRDI